MGIFSRRAVQQMINENSEFLTEEQINNHVSRLNREGFQSLDTLWEVAILNAFSKLGNVVHEPELEGKSKLDLLFTCKDGATFIADITSVSDEGFEREFSVKAFDVELSRRLKKAGLLFKGWYLRVGSHPAKKYNENPRPKLPPRADFAKEIFNFKFKDFLRQVKENPEQTRTYMVSNENTEITLTYHLQNNYFTSQMPALINVN